MYTQFILRVTYLLWKAQLSFEADVSCQSSVSSLTDIGSYLVRGILMWFYGLGTLGTLNCLAWTFGTSLKLTRYVCMYNICVCSIYQQNELECRCEGEALTRVPQTLQLPLQRLTIASAGMPRLRSVGLKVYGATLLDVWV